MSFEMNNYVVLDIYRDSEGRGQLYRVASLDSPINPMCQGLFKGTHLFSRDYLEKLMIQEGIVNMAFKPFNDEGEPEPCYDEHGKDVVLKALDSQDFCDLLRTVPRDCSIDDLDLNEEVVIDPEYRLVEIFYKDKYPFEYRLKALELIEADETDNDKNDQTMVVSYNDMMEMAAAGKVDNAYANKSYVHSLGGTTMLLNIVKPNKIKKNKSKYNNTDKVFHGVIEKA